MQTLMHATQQGLTYASNISPSTNQATNESSMALGLIKFH